MKNKMIMLVSLLLSLTGCTTVFKEKKTDGVAVRSVPVINPLNIPRHQAGCGDFPVYEHGGRRYQVLKSSRGFVEQGLAIPYSGRANGLQTAACETLDLNTYSAAHRRLPLFSYVRVINIASGRSVVVRINDRGPFNSHANIQLSHAAARAIGIPAANSSLQVRIEGVSDRQTGRSLQSTYVAPDAGLANSNKSTTSSKRAQAKGRAFYIVVGSYATQLEAVDTFTRLTSAGLSRAEMVTANHKGRQVHQVRLGPLYNQDEIDNVKNVLESNGLATFRVVGIKG